MQKKKKKKERKKRKKKESKKRFWTKSLFFSGLRMYFYRLRYLIWSDGCLLHLKHVLLGFNVYHASRPKWVVYTGHIRWWTEYQHMIHLCLLAKDQFARMAVELNGDYSVWQVQCLQLHIISQSLYFQHWSSSPYKFQKNLIDIISFSHKSRMAL